jgi:hypothetical protein
MQLISKFLIAGYNNPDSLISALERFKAENIAIHEVIMPTADRGLQRIIPQRKSRIPEAALFGGVLGGILGFGLQFFASTGVYPLQFGGKPNLAVLSFMPVTFECIILFAAIAGFVVFLGKLRSKKVSGDFTRYCIAGDRCCVLLEISNDDPRISVVKETNPNEMIIKPDIPL